MPAPQNSARPDDPHRFFSNRDDVLRGASLPSRDGGNTALTIVQQIARMRDSISFADLKRRAEFLAGEPLERGYAGLWTYDHLVRVDPTPRETAVGRIFEVYRFTVNRGFGTPHMITGASFERDAIQLSDKTVLDAAFGKVQHHASSLLEWPIRVPPGSELTVTRELLREAWLQILDCGENQPVHFHDVSQVTLGTATTLGLPARERILWPFAFVTLDRRGLEPGMYPWVGWVDRIEERGLGEHHCATFQRDRGLIFDRAVTIRNGGDVAFHLSFTRPLKSSPMI